ncbi:hypothetical protein EDI_092780 [Entamoeba dispar SAW760]|uniref:Uncharacterized protein n=1 Tax=Entamoeba dispar (strain ATCC PRA-260 / SAW760) TaxID=370354 RepID=B0ED70_ENTDS|nr:uncharacterized protein EDI_092780 [Entamoeba dispar SAW760]EDR27487.1 hypothetical protein EDI_092780 [Entamoeba dispar SAW760]|eukprot:EDR27487.1 hypothetical protein EDI_092780 [Entamoeba dispar SAW760]
MSIFEGVSFEPSEHEKRENALKEIKGMILELEKEVSDKTEKEQEIEEKLNTIATKEEIDKWKKEISDFECPSNTEQELTVVNDVIKNINYFKRCLSLKTSEERKKVITELKEKKKTLKIAEVVYNELQNQEKEELENKIKEAVNVNENSIILKKVKGDISFYKCVWQCIINSRLNEGNEIVVIEESQFIKICIGTPVESFDDFVSYLKTLLKMIQNIIDFYQMPDDAVIDAASQFVPILSKARSGCNESEFDKEWNDEIITDVFKKETNGLVWKKIIYMLLFERNLGD